MNRKPKMAQDQILTLSRAGFSARRISKELGIARDTVRNYLKAAGVELKPGRYSTAKPASSPPASPVEAKPPDDLPAVVSSSQCEPYRSWIEERLERGMQMKSVWQDLVDQQGFTGSYNAVKRFAGKLKVKTPQAFAVIHTLPGMEAQVDYGRGAPTKDDKGRHRRPWLFSMKLSYSRKAFRKVLWKSSSSAWSQLHEEAFRYFGGAPQTIRLDNLKEGVIKADLYDPTLNPLYEALLKYYGVVALPCRVATPRHKGKVESDINYAQNGLKGRRFEHIDEQNRYLFRWNERWADTRVHGRTKRQVQKLFLEEKPSLQALPEQNFPLIKILKRKVHVDCHVLVDGTFYSAPHHFVGKTLIVYLGKSFVELLDPQSSQSIVRHLIASAGHFQTEEQHYPKAKQTLWLHGKLITRAQAIGGATATLVKAILRQKPYHSIRQCQGVLAFTRKYSKETLENCAKLCVEKQLYSYRSLKRLLEHQESSEAPKPLTQIHPLIREASEYATLWDQLKIGGL